MVLCFTHAGVKCVKVLKGALCFTHSGLVQMGKMCKFTVLSSSYLTCAKLLVSVG